MITKFTRTFEITQINAFIKLNETIAQIEMNKIELWKVAADRNDH